ncbi:MAG: hypothetical protein AAF562_12250 [Pseudomonadota bacterium]
MADTDQQTTNGHIAYGLYAASLIIGFTAIAGVIFCYIKRTDYSGDLWGSHMTWLIRTFWISLIIFLVSVPLTVILIGFLSLLIGGIWFIYRIIKGWIFWNDKKPLPAPEGLF